MKTLYAAVLGIFLPICFAGRAFPVLSEQYTEGVFQAVNPDIVKDPTNYLTDLSGQYSMCTRANDEGGVDVERKTPEGASIRGLVDTAAGEGTTVNVVGRYIKNIISTWPEKSEYREQIKRAEKFGCSVQPACKGRVVVVCLFSPGYNGGGNIELPPGGQPGSGKLARAFTDDQYELAENFFGTSWDRSHALENLSGRETQCAMIGKKNWPFKFAKKYANARKPPLRLTHQYGSAKNRGDTEDAMAEILNGWKKTKSTKMGCSVIPDCQPPGGPMMVVVSCLFKEA